MDEREARLRRTCEKALDGVRLQRPFTIESFCEALSSKRGRRIVLQEMPDTGGLNAPCGLWIAYRHEDHIWHVKATSQRHRSQVILHEIAHMLLDHQSDAGTSSLLAALPPEISLARIRRAFGRTDYSAEQEHDAELAGSILDEIVDSLPTAPSTSRDALFTRVDEAMAHPRKYRG
ncbi:secondary metabolite protein [Streptomyces sp. NPDC048665]|uniref:secondary metabolite protein n=1 Tax=Streptomyces sp. NPDC048665 TaxID=3155490 RepID=UPI003414558F